MKFIRLKIEAIFNILFSRNFILVYRIKEIKIGEKPARTITVIRSTHYTDQSDLLSLEAAKLIIVENPA